MHVRRKRASGLLVFGGMLGLLALAGCSKNTTPEAEQKIKLQEAGQARQAENSPGGTPIPAQRGASDRTSDGDK